MTRTMLQRKAIRVAVLAGSLGALLAPTAVANAWDFPRPGIGYDDTGTFLDDSPWLTVEKSGTQFTVTVEPLAGWYCHTNRVDLTELSPKQLVMGPGVTAAQVPANKGDRVSGPVTWTVDIAPGQHALGSMCTKVGESDSFRNKMFTVTPDGDLRPGWGVTLNDIKTEVPLNKDTATQSRTRGLGSLGSLGSGSLATLFGS